MAIDLFAPVKLGGMTLPNRFVRSAQGAGDPDSQIEDLTALVRGEVGLIISGHTYVEPEGRFSSGQTAIDRDECVPALARMVDAVHRNGGKIVIQLSHAGVAATIDDIPVGPSEFRLPQSGRMTRTLTVAGIERIKAAFVAASQRAELAGFDGIQLHAAHGFLLSQFLSPYFNHRTDLYGGPVANRARLLLEIVDAIRARQPTLPLLVKLNSQDYLDGGLSEDDALATALLLEQHGVAGIEVSGGTVYSPSGLGPGRPETPVECPSYRDAAARFRAALSRTAVILVDGIRSRETAVELVRGGVTDFISLCRPLLREPDLIRRWHREADGL